MWFMIVAICFVGSHRPITGEIQQLFHFSLARYILIISMNIDVDNICMI